MQPRLSTVRSRIGTRLVHPGEILLEQFMRPYGISQNALARSFGVSPRRINEIVNGRRAITVETAIGLGEVIGPSPHYWMALQSDYDIEIARARQMKLGARPCKPMPEVECSVAFAEDERGWVARWVGYRNGP